MLGNDCQIVNFLSLASENILFHAEVSIPRGGSLISLKTYFISSQGVVDVTQRLNSSVSTLKSSLTAN